MFVVQTYSLCDGWTNRWTIDLQPQLFETVEEAQADLDEFFEGIQDDIRRGYRKPNEGYSRCEFRIRPFS